MMENFIDVTHGVIKLIKATVLKLLSFYPFDQLITAM